MSGLTPEQRATAAFNALTVGELRALVLDIHRQFDGTEWDSGTASDVAQRLTDAGFVIRDPDGMEPGADDLEPVDG